MKVSCKTGQASGKDLAGLRGELLEEVWVLEVDRVGGNVQATAWHASVGAAEVATAMVIMVAAQYGLPTSSSQCITGGIVGIGLVEGMEGVNWKFFTHTFSSWIMTMVVMGLGTALMFAQGHNAP